MMHPLSTVMSCSGISDSQPVAQGSHYDPQPHKKNGMVSLHGADPASLGHTSTSITSRVPWIFSELHTTSGPHRQMGPWLASWRVSQLLQKHKAHWCTPHQLTERCKRHMLLQLLGNSSGFTLPRRWHHLGSTHCNPGRGKGGCIESMMIPVFASEVHGLLKVRNHCSRSTGCSSTIRYTPSSTVQTSPLPYPQKSSISFCGNPDQAKKYSHNSDHACSSHTHQGTEIQYLAIFTWDQLLNPEPDTPIFLDVCLKDKALNQTEK